jgi:hypothetical protein
MTTHTDNIRIRQAQPLITPWMPAEELPLQEQQAIRGVMLESHLVGGNRGIGPAEKLTYGQSISDACLSLEETAPLLEQLANAVRKTKAKCAADDELSEPPDN